MLHAIVFGGIAIVVVSALVAWAGANLKSSRSAVFKEKAIEIAEAGIDYYRWHLAHSPQDFTDGTGNYNPHAHNFYDKDGVLIGSYTLRITPPLTGSTIVTVESTGQTIENASTTRTIRTKLAIPSLAKFAFVSDSDMRFGAGTEIFGPVHSNGGIRFDGLVHNIISSARATYNDPDYNTSQSLAWNISNGNCTNSSFGVHTCESPADPSPPAATPSRTDIFESGRQFPVPDVDFDGLTSNLAQMKTDAQTSAGRYFAASGALGYKIVFSYSAATTTFKVYRVNSLRNPPNNCVNPGQTGWGTWSIATAGNALTQINGPGSGGKYSVPSNGIIFFEDNVWVEGIVGNARVTVASGRFPDNASTRTSITVNDDLNYTYTDGTDVISLIAQNNINVGLYSADSLEIDAALMAQNGRVGRYYYTSSCSVNYARQEITLYGMIATSQRYGFSWTGSSFACGGSIGDIGSGYCVRNITYDANLLYGPPPSFPLASDQYTTISWEEI